MYYDDDEGDAVICCYGLFAHKLVQKIKVSDLHADGSNSINPNESFSQVKVTRLVLSQDNKSYFIGYEDGLVQEISAIDLQLIETWKKGKQEGYGEVNDIYGDKDLVIVVHEKGRLNIYKIDNDENLKASKTNFNQEDGWIVKSIDLKYPVKTIKVANQQSTLIVFVES